MFDIALLFQWVQSHLNYWTITLLMAVESSFIPFPSEVVVPPAAYFAMHDGNLNICLVVLFATIGALIGATINYFLSMWIGRPLIYKFANSRLGHICLINQEKVDKAEKYFDKHGAGSTFVGRLIPAVRQLISIPAGLAKMNFGKFVFFTSLGAGLWNIVLASLGYFLSLTVAPNDLRDEIEHYNSYLNIAGYILAVIILGFIFYNMFKKKSKKNLQEPY